MDAGDYQPMTKYQLIYTDPPWRTAAWGKQPENGNLRQAQAQSKPELVEGSRRSRQPPYPTMTDAELLALPVGDLAAADSVLLMWVLDHKLEFALELGKTWGFEFNTVGFYWLKRTPCDNAWNYGTGYATRAGSVEQCWLFTRGNGLVRADKGVRRLYDDIVFYPETVIHPVMEHSRKPDEIRHRIERLYGDVPRIELFARRIAPGWAHWGNEVVSSPEAAAVLDEPEPRREVRQAHLGRTFVEG
jgi:N6-adenosine-specific RNA methylase IME4